MTRDYKQNASPRPTRRLSWSTLLVGLLSGLVIGLAIALAVAWYINRMPSPFASKNGNASATASEPSKSEPVKPEPSATPKFNSKADAKPSPKPDPKLATGDEGKTRFDFYKILPGAEETLSEQDLKQRGVEKTPAQSKDVYFLQAGAFQNAADADNMKARLALIGMEATIQTIAVPEKGMLHRVRLGPFTSVDELNRARSALKQNGVQSTPIKVSEARTN